MSPRANTPRHNTAADTTKAVDELMKSLVHPATKEIQALRKIILAADPSILEGVKWNAPSFRTAEYFATVNLRSKRCIGVILHFGAKARAIDARRSIDDPAGMLQWLAVDRAAVDFESLRDLKEKEAAFQSIVKQWVELS
jgi:hypothetical protein